MDSIVLKDPRVYPEVTVLEKALAGSYKAYREMMEIITGPGYDLMPEWRYYNDGKAWLCKVVHKKKTVFWLSVWDGYFKAGFYFTEKSGAGIASLDLDPDVKKSFASNKAIGKLIPLAFVIKESKDLEDLLKVILYKKNLK